MTKISTTLTGKSLPDKIAYHTVRDRHSVLPRPNCRMQISGARTFRLTNRSSWRDASQHHRHRCHRVSIPSACVSWSADKWWSNRYFGKLLTALGGFSVTRGTADGETLGAASPSSKAAAFNALPRVNAEWTVVQPLFGAAYIAMKTGARSCR